MAQETQQACGGQAPELFVCGPQDTDWMFYEVKGPQDCFRESQIELFSTLAAVTGRAVGLLRVKGT